MHFQGQFTTDSRTSNKIYKTSCCSQLFPTNLLAKTATHSSPQAYRQPILILLQVFAPITSITSSLNCSSRTALILAETSTENNGVTYKHWEPLSWRLSPSVIKLWREASAKFTTKWESGWMISMRVIKPPTSTVQTMNSLSNNGAIVQSLCSNPQKQGMPSRKPPPLRIGTPKPPQSNTTTTSRNSPTKYSPSRPWLRRTNYSTSITSLVPQLA